MKILRAIGGFFAKIGRWIANTAWVQPLLIVGGIFAIIFSIPYIKKGIEGLQTDTTDYKYQYYKDRSLDLKEGGKADKLLGYLEDYKDNKENIKKEFGSQFLLTFVKQNCQNCKDAVEGYKYVANNYNSKFTNKFKMYTILVDKTNDEGDYLAKPIVEKHNDLFDVIAGLFEDDAVKEDYPVFKNTTGKADGVISKLKELSGITTEGMETPTTFMVDIDGYEDGAFGINGITQFFFNYIDYIDSDTINAATKGNLLRDMWTYQNIFDPEYEKIS